MMNISCVKKSCPFKGAGFFIRYDTTGIDLRSKSMLLSEAKDKIRRMYKNGCK